MWDLVVLILYHCLSIYFSENRQGRTKSVNCENLYNVNESVLR